MEKTVLANKVDGELYVTLFASSGRYQRLKDTSVVLNTSIKVNLS